MITIGGKTKDQLIAAIEVNGARVSKTSREMMHTDAFTTLPEPTHVRLVKLPLLVLGFRRYCNANDLLDRAKEDGLNPCPPEVAPCLRLVDRDQPCESGYRIGMRPIVGADGKLRLFKLDRNYWNGRWLRNELARPADLWRPTSEFIFLAPEEAPR